MTRLSTSVIDYKNRKVDMLAFDDAKASGEALVTQALLQPNSGGALTTGINKLVQRFILELLTERGSLQYQPDRGTFFMTQFRSGIIQTSQALFSAFSTAEVDLKKNLKLEESDSDPADERYDSSELLNASLDGDRANLSIKVVSRAGESITFIYPLRIAP